MDGARSSSRPRPSSRPTTPLRPSSRSSLREAHGYGHSISNAGYNQPAINALEPQFAELADSMADLEANFMHLQLMHESLTRFSESFASFLYGLNMNAFCLDFPEAPIADSFRRAKQAEAQKEAENEPDRPDDGEMTFLSIDRTQDHRYLLCRTPSQHRFQTDIEILSTYTRRYSGHYTRLGNEPVRNTRDPGCSTECTASRAWDAVKRCVDKRYQLRLHMADMAESS
ncbi:Aconitate hydratase [Penicillium atrosanguineum]|uniref:Aconitate hydratase n=1 Tax=Penicillium atrosanguineum TaxID=1132637 RepID=UPI002392D486|nr:Aconitate hydratase [Penicillium atrosanguineum]KAJ5292434.1 Aconitate hydratase [Penicillium atrosanguineum]